MTTAVVGSATQVDRPHPTPTFSLTTSAGR